MLTACARLAAGAAALLLLAFSQPVLAAPAVSINTKLAEISVTIDDALKTYPGLVADLTAEGKNGPPRPGPRPRRRRRTIRSPSRKAASGPTSAITLSARSPVTATSAWFARMGPSRAARIRTS